MKKDSRSHDGVKGWWGLCGLINGSISGLECWRLFWNVNDKSHEELNWKTNVLKRTFSQTNCHLTNFQIIQCLANCIGPFYNWPKNIFLVFSAIIFLGKWMLCLFLLTPFSRTCQSCYPNCVWLVSSFNISPKPKPSHCTQSGTQQR